MKSKQITDIYNSAIDKFVPNVKIRKDSMKLISDQTLKLIKEKNSLLRKKYRNKNNASFKNICADIKQINTLIENSIKDDVSKQIDSLFYLNRILLK